MFKQIILFKKQKKFLKKILEIKWKKKSKNVIQKIILKKYKKK